MKPISRSFTGKEYEALEQELKERFKEIGFGVLHEIDFQQTLINKIGKDVGLYKQLQICNPHLAHEAIQIDPSIGIQLPCNVLIRAKEQNLIVDVQSPFDSIPESSPAELKEMAKELDERIKDLLSKI